MAVSAARNEQLRRYVENRHIDHIPAGARHGKPWHQFAFWFGGNVNVFNVVLGAVTVTIGLTFWWALVAIGAGSAFAGPAGVWGVAGVGCCALLVCRAIVQVGLRRR